MGRLWIVGLGPGAPEHMSARAREALEEAELVVGYTGYLKLAAPLIRGKATRATGMTKEIERCSIAIDEALSGRRVALVSSGDPGIYAMAGLAIELCRARGIRISLRGGGPPGALPVEVIPGIPALVAGAALLGAPLAHDFCAVSLSDRLTPWEVIERRLRAAAEADFVIGIYNPRSRKRDWQLGRAKEILLEYRSPETPVGIVKRAMREGERVEIRALGELDPECADMETVLIVGNSGTYTWEGAMITPRGYGRKYALLKVSKAGGA